MIDDHALFGWPAVIGLAALIQVAGWIVGTATIRRRNASLARLREPLLSLGASTRDGFAVSGKEFSLFVVGELFTIVHTVQRKVLRTYNDRDVVGIRIHRRRNDAIDYRLLLEGGATTRDFETDSVIDFLRLFLWMVRRGKSVQFVVGEERPCR